MVEPEKSWEDALAALPVSEFLSSVSWAGLRQFVASGASYQRGHRLVEFFKAIDWLPVSRVTPNPLKQLDQALQQQLQGDIRRYLEDKKAKRHARKTYRDNYILRVFEYFRTQVSAEDKKLLEGLRDYELDHIHQDINWRHYFWFTSFKQIDAFNQQSPQERAALIEQFKKDVALYHKNAERLKDGSYSSYYWGGEASHEEAFESWTAWQTASQSARQRRQRSQQPAQEVTFVQAYQHLQLPFGASLMEVRRRFRQLALQHHPDTAGGDSEAMKQILTAYQQIQQFWETEAPHRKQSPV